MYSSTDNESPDQVQKEKPSVYGREQFERETGALHADEEYAAELTPVVTPLPSRDKGIRDTDTGAGQPAVDVGRLVADDPAGAAQSRTLGITGLVLAALSLFLLPAILGPASVVVGFAAYVRGSRTLGLWTMVLGILAVAAYYVLVPYYT